MLNAYQKKHIIAKYQLSSNDTGSTEVQVALLTSRIINLQKHFSIHVQDFHSRRGLLDLVNRRRKLLSYLKRKSIFRYLSLIKNLDLRK